MQPYQAIIAKSEISYLFKFNAYKVLNCLENFIPF